jgi:hypothetical protein
MANDISISIDSIRAAMAAHLVSGVGRSYKKTNPNLLAEERAHVERVVDGYLIEHLCGACFVRHDNGDVGIAFGGSYKTGNVVKRCADPETSRATVIFARGEDMEIRCSPHLNVVFPSGFYTTWTPANFTNLGDEEGRLGFAMQYWEGDSVWEKRAKQAAADVCETEPAQQELI